MNKHKVLFNIINNSITFFLRYYTHPGALSFPVLTISTKKTKIIPIVTHQDVFSNQILKKGLPEKIDNFLKTPEKR